jgi:DNA-binding CsgD family transcriptional regulator
MLASRQSRNQKKSINKIVLPGVDLNSRTPKTWSRPSASVSSIIGAMPEEIQVDFALANRWAVQEELNRLAGEIHDGLAQHLSAICLQLVVAKELISSTRGNPLCKIEQAIELANLGLVEARRYAHNLGFSAVDESGLLAELQRLAERWTVDDKFRCNFESELMSRRVSRPRVVIMTTYDCEQDVCRAARAGAKAFLVKVAGAQQIREAVRRVAEGETFFSPEIGLKLAEALSYPELSKREIQVLQHLACGKSNKEIGCALYICEGTIKSHISSILRKLNALGRAEAIAIAARRGLLQVG